ncbi:hypothetical protein QTO34_004474 [Cnephaeus nilssonii]|uniref:Uncharacterized protein n=1 Tax=Cnephaeus nilssonii TaxID=3371016 RepID=A0AA40HQB1_CNENI|nr:hypothetical protein QTO34_004474 [Eptesicus nilssonii]
MPEKLSASCWRLSTTRALRSRGSMTGIRRLRPTLPWPTTTGSRGGQRLQEEPRTLLQETIGLQKIDITLFFKIINEKQYRWQCPQPQDGSAQSPQPRQDACLWSPPVPSVPQPPRATRGAGLFPPNYPPLLAILWQPSCVHMGAAILHHTHPLKVQSDWGQRCQQMRVVAAVLIAPQEQGAGEKPSGAIRAGSCRLHPLMVPSASGGSGTGCGCEWGQHWQQHLLEWRPGPAGSMITEDDPGEGKNLLDDRKDFDKPWLPNALLSFIDLTFFKILFDHYIEVVNEGIFTGDFHTNNFSMGSMGFVQDAKMDGAIVWPSNGLRDSELAPCLKSLRTPDISCCSVPKSHKGLLKKSNYGVIYSKAGGYEGQQRSKSRSPERFATSGLYAEYHKAGWLSAGAPGLPKASSAAEAFESPCAGADSQPAPPLWLLIAGELAGCPPVHQAFRKPPAQRPAGPISYPGHPESRPLRLLLAQSVEIRR